MSETRTYTTFTMSEARVVGMDWRTNAGVRTEWTEPVIIDKDEAMSILTAYKLYPHDWMISLEQGGKVNCGNVVLTAWE